ncbi:hypothetical protein ES703_118869 [subsurface metagenome]
MPRLVAAEILTSAWCPFNCTYCYIPKTSQMHALHDEVVESLKSGRAFDILKQVIGEDLTELGFWGTEPSLTLPVTCTVSVACSAAAEVIPIAGSRRTSICAIVAFTSTRLLTLSHCQSSTPKIGTSPIWRTGVCSFLSITTSLSPLTR